MTKQCALAYLIALVLFKHTQCGNRKIHVIWALFVCSVRFCLFFLISSQWSAHQWLVWQTFDKKNKNTKSLQTQIFSHRILIMCSYTTFFCLCMILEFFFLISWACAILIFPTIKWSNAHHSLHRIRNFVTMFDSCIVSSMVFFLRFLAQ